MTIKEAIKSLRKEFGANWCDLNESENGSCEIVFWSQRKGVDKPKCTRRDKLTKARWSKVLSQKPYLAKLTKVQAESLKRVFKHRAEFKFKSGKAPTESQFSMRANWTEV